MTSEQGLWERGVSSERLLITVTGAVAERERTRCLSRGERAARSHPPRTPSLATLGAEQALLAARRLTSVPDPLAPEPASQERGWARAPTGPLSGGVGPTLPQLRHPPRCPGPAGAELPGLHTLPALVRGPRPLLVCSVLSSRGVWPVASWDGEAFLCSKGPGPGELREGPGHTLSPGERGPSRRMVSGLRCRQLDVRGTIVLCITGGKAEPPVQPGLDISFKALVLWMLKCT